MRHRCTGRFVRTIKPVPSGVEVTRWTSFDHLACEFFEESSMAIFAQRVAVGSGIPREYLEYIDTETGEVIK